MRFFFALMLFSCALWADSPKKPNIVFILADDLGWGETGCYGQKKIPTPNIDALAKDGMRFTRAYCGAPVCAPSRCVLMTGKHLGHAEIRGNIQAKTKFPEFDEGQLPLSESAVTFPMLLQKAGYITGAMGKWGLGPVGSTGDPSKKGIEYFFGYNCQAVAHSYYPPYLWRNAEKVTINKKPISGHPKAIEGDVKLSDYQGEKYAPKLMIEEAEAFIGKNYGKPFFLYLPFIEPHVSMHPPEESVNKFPKEWDDTQYHGGNGYTPHPRPRAAYAAMISDLDSYVGRVLKALDKAGVTDDTLIVFSSDNGTTMPSGTEKQFNVGGVDAKFFNSTAGLRGFKGTVYEGGIRVPMIVKYPGVIKPGTTNESPCYFADWFPTMMEVTGQKVPVELDGESLWPTLTTGKAFVRKKPMIYVFPETQGQVAVIDGDKKFVRTKLKTKTPGPWEVYNLATDPGEKTDLAKSSQAEIEKIETLLKKEVAENTNFPVLIPGVTPSVR